ncbi:MAG TPA: peptidylprolyl isomerase [Candidatus Dormibacteraeota bacterium]|nr:peptidylprolyl isomerase [Candidatus Dormibacteraeota bacterium]
MWPLALRTLAAHMGRLSLFVATACAASVCACGSSSPAPSAGANAIVARVGSTSITQALFDVRLQSALTAIQQGGGTTANAAMQVQVRASVLRSLVLDSIIASEAASRGLAATGAQVQAQVDADARAVGGLSTLQSQLASAGGSLAQLQDEIRSQLNEQRLEDAFAQERAAQAEEQLASGTVFATVAKEMSDDTNTSAIGGDLGAISQAQLGSYDPAFAAAVRSLAVGMYTLTPVHDAGGYDIIEVYARAAGSWSVRHILVAAPTPYTVTSRPAWFSEALFVTVAQLCGAGQIHVYIHDAGADPCSGAPSFSATVTP